MIDNFDAILPLLDWRTKDDFYFLQILQRKKDHKETGKVNGTNNNSRLVKPYYVKNKEHFEFIKPEVIELCKLFNARAGINLNRRSFERVAFQTLKKITDSMMNREFERIYRAYDTACGYAHESDKKWIIDLDAPDVENVQEIVKVIEDCQPFGKTKLLAELPSKSGIHLITSPFDRSVFSKVFPTVEVHTNNPTNAYIV